MLLDLSDLREIYYSFCSASITVFIDRFYASVMARESRKFWRRQTAYTRIRVGKPSWSLAANMTSPLTYRSQDSASSIGPMANSPGPSHTNLEPWNAHFHVAVNDLSVDPFGLLPLYPTEGPTPAVLSAPVTQQRQFSEGMDDGNFGYVLRSPPVQYVSR